VLVFWAMVNVHMDLLTCVLYNKIADSSDTAVSKGRLMIDEWNGRIKLGGPSWPNWNHSFNNFHYELWTGSSTSVRAGRHPTDFHIHQLPSEGEIRWRLNRSGRVHTFRRHEFWIFLYFRSGVFVKLLFLWDMTSCS
jgi:hypothetical protein